MFDELITNAPQALPGSMLSIRVRPGTLGDVEFMDRLQRKTTLQVGWMPRAQLEGKITAGHVLVATVEKDGSSTRVEEGSPAQGSLSNHIDNVDEGNAGGGVPVGYLIGNDQYFKRDDVGIIYQMNVLPEYRRSMIGARLLAAQFERSAYGCRLYCCWCAQDIEANRFWESMGFVPLAFRTGGKVKLNNRSSGTKGNNTGSPGSADGVMHDGSMKVPTARIHIFWQKRIVRGDTTTRWWYPSKTDGGAIRADRIVLPIPKGKRWSDEMPIFLPPVDEPANEDGRIEGSTKKRLTGSTVKKSQSRAKSVEKGTQVKEQGDGKMGRSWVQFGPPGMTVPAPVVEKVEPQVVEKVEEEMELVKREPRRKTKTNPLLLKAVREYRDRWLEMVDRGEGPVERAKWEVGRTLDERVSEELRALESASTGLQEAA